MDKSTGWTFLYIFLNKVWLRGADPGLGINRLPVQNQIQAPSPSPATPHQWQTQQPFHYRQRLFHRLHCPTLQQPAFLLNADLKIWLENSSRDQKGHEETPPPPPPHLKHQICTGNHTWRLPLLHTLQQLAWMRCTCQTWACERLRSLWAGCSGIPMTGRASWARAPRWGAGSRWGHGRRRGRWRRCHPGFDLSTPAWS